jgi:hypothetical protein
MNRVKGALSGIAAVVFAMAFSRAGVAGMPATAAQAINEIALAPNGLDVAAPAGRHTIAVYSAITGRREVSLPWYAGDCDLTTLSYSSDGRFLIGFGVECLPDCEQIGRMCVYSVQDGGGRITMSASASRSGRQLTGGFTQGGTLVLAETDLVATSDPLYNLRFLNPATGGVAPGHWDTGHVVIGDNGAALTGGELPADGARYRRSYTAVVFPPEAVLEIEDDLTSGGRVVSILDPRTHHAQKLPVGGAIRPVSADVSVGGDRVLLGGEDAVWAIDRGSGRTEALLPTLVHKSGYTYAAVVVDEVRLSRDGDVAAALINDFGDALRDYDAMRRRIGTPHHGTATAARTVSFPTRSYLEVRVWRVEDRRLLCTILV